MFCSEGGDQSQCVKSLSYREGRGLNVTSAVLSGAIVSQWNLTQGRENSVARAVLNHSMSSLADQTLNKMARQTVGSPRRSYNFEYPSFDTLVPTRLD